MQRRILAIAAAILLLSAAVLWLFFPDTEGYLAFCWRGGAILAAAWLAYSDVQRIPNWLLATLPVVLLIVVRWPRHALLLIPVLLGWAAVRKILHNLRS